MLLKFHARSLVLAGHHANSILGCFRSVLREHGPRAFVVSLPLTLTTNVPYAAIMGTTNEATRKMLSPNDDPTAAVHMAAGACSGAIAAAATAPLDAVKTRLQTQHLHCHGTAAAVTAAAMSSDTAPRQPLTYTSALQACAALYREGGIAAFYRGVQVMLLLAHLDLGLTLSILLTRP